MLVLGGTQFVGHAVVSEALERGYDVTVANRGTSGAPPAGTRHVRIDRTAPGAYEPLESERYDLVVDTWSGAPAVVRDAARALGPSTDRWVYVSSRSVYAWPPAHGADESHPVVPGDPDADATDYAADKRGAELALERELGATRTAFLRAGLILGPRENVGRLPWWLRRIARGGEVLAPAPPALPIQYVDARDLAALALTAAEHARFGPVDVVCAPGKVTLGALLRQCVEVTRSDAELVWVDPDFLLDRDVEPWNEVPVWIPADHEAYGLHTADVARAASWGMRTRPLADTVADTWSWLQEGIELPTPPYGAPGLDPARERELLDLWAQRS
jgi:nucleoside-diphosphate-sugar epimerase